MDRRRTKPEPDDTNRDGESHNLDVMGTSGRDAGSQFKVEIEGVTQGAFVREQAGQVVEDPALLLPIEDLDFTVSDTANVVILDQDIETEYSTQSDQQQIIIDHVGLGVTGKSVESTGSDNFDKLDFSETLEAEVAIDHVGAGLVDAYLPNAGDQANGLAMEEFLEDQTFIMDPINDEPSESIDEEDDIDGA